MTEIGSKALMMSFKDIKTELRKVLDCSKDDLNVHKDDILKYLAGKRKEIEQREEVMTQYSIKVITITLFLKVEPDLDHNIHTDRRMQLDAIFRSLKEDIELGLSNSELIDALKNGMDNQLKGNEIEIGVIKQYAKSKTNEINLIKRNKRLRMLVI